MGRIIYDTATSINGLIADEDNSLEWLFAIAHDIEPDSALVPPDAPVMVMGSTTYEWILAAADILAEPEKWQAFHGERSAFVFTHRQLPVPAGADVRFVSGQVADALAQMRDVAGGGDIWVMGGGDLAAQFLAAAALDEIRLSVAPVMLAGGAPLFSQRVEWPNLQLVSATTEGPFARLIYQVT